MIDLDWEDQYRENMEKLSFSIEENIIKNIEQKEYIQNIRESLERLYER